VPNLFLWLEELEDPIEGALSRKLIRHSFTPLGFGSSALTSSSQNFPKLPRSSFKSGKRKSTSAGNLSPTAPFYESGNKPKRDKLKAKKRKKKKIREKKREENIEEEAPQEEGPEDEGRSSMRVRKVKRWEGRRRLNCPTMKNLQKVPPLRRILTHG
jgi:hypothetical protein